MFGSHAVGNPSYHLRTDKTLIYASLSLKALEVFLSLPHSPP
jgi:hypothetical protein